jgi:thiamine monophosphate synthase
VTASTQRGRYSTPVRSNLVNARLYGIIDLGYVEASNAGGIVEQMIEGGVDLIQLRGKNKSIGQLVE